jgi:hypothetical protein
VASATKQFTLTIATSVVINSVLNAASYVGGAVSPGEIVVIFGSGMGPSTLSGLQLDSKGYVATQTGGTTVSFDGIAAAIGRLPGVDHRRGDRGGR